MGVVGAVSGTKLYIGDANVAPSPDNYVEIKEISNMGEIGTTFAKIAVESIGSGYTRQIKGTESAPAFDITMNRLDTDPGQTALAAASATANRNKLYNFRLVENDIGGGASATTILFQGRVYGVPKAYGGVNTLKTIKTSIEIEPDTISVTPAA